jgi:Domain of unknown function (DUF4893)
MLRTLVILALLAGPALATGSIVSIITAEDRARLDGFDATKSSALKESEAGPVEDRKTLAEALAGDPLPLRDAKLAGNWRCRVIKVGGPYLPLVVYPNFKCRITEGPEGLMLEKRTGSQLTKGLFYDDGEKRLIYLGAGRVQGEKPRRYNDDPQYNEPAYAFLRAPNRLTIEFPKPKFESNFNVLVLER